MGQEITDSEFDAAAFERFRQRLDDETRLLGDWQAVKRGRVGRRIGRRVTGRATGRLLRRLFK